MTSKIRQALIATAREMATSGLNRGTAGNLSLRGTWNGQPGFWITPTGMAYADLQPEDIPFVEMDQPGDADSPRRNAASPRKASSEWRLHLDLYAAHPDAGAILHAHSPFATSLACLRREIPPFHYMIARFGGNTVRCADYALFGTQALSDAAVTAMKERSACLLANHGMVVCATGLGKALDAAIELEALCEQYWRACQLGTPVILNDAEMAAVKVRFADYGKQD
jgi:L-fuculose-phosphate aldolase